jgi:membrane protease YdiL (CAAX protease family)
MLWDFALILLVLGVVVPWRSTVRMRQLMAAPGGTTSEQRLVIYGGTMAAQWLLAGFALWRSFAHGISARALGLALDHAAPALVAAIALTVALAAVQFFGLRRLARLPAEKQGFAGVLARKLLPQNLVETLVFAALAATVAVCEEFLYRGFLLSILRDALGGIPVAVVISTSLFALGHLYQGARGMTSTFFLGLLFCSLRLLTGSLVPCVGVHFGVDLLAGLAAPRLLSPPGGHRHPAAAPAAGGAPQEEARIK